VGGCCGCSRRAGNNVRTCAAIYARSDRNGGSGSRADGAGIDSGAGITSRANDAMMLLDMLGGSKMLCGGCSLDVLHVGLMGMDLGLLGLLRMLNMERALDLVDMVHRMDVMCMLHVSLVGVSMSIGHGMWVSKALGRTGRCYLAGVVETVARDKRADR
jgi:hypothetical protein